MKIKRWDIWLVSFNPSRWSEQSWVRPALIIQNDIWNKYSVNTIVLAISSKQWNIKLDIPIEPTKCNNLKLTSYVKCNQILTISNKRLIKNMWELSSDELYIINNALSQSLGLWI